MEIERQFLVKALPALPLVSDRLEQGYVAFLPEIRIRAVNGERFFLTVKRGTGLVRQEWETPVSREEYENLVQQLEPGTLLVKKRRYRLPLAGGWTAELFVHSGHLDGFAYVEVEFPDEAAAERFRPPAWFGRELTEDAGFSYRTFAREEGGALARQLMGSR